MQWDPALTEPGHGCQGSVLGLPVAQPKFLFFSNPAATSRTKMTVRRSTDAGRSWPLSHVVHPEGSAYSCMTEMPRPVRANSAPRSLRRALLTPQVNPGSRYRCGRSA